MPMYVGLGQLLLALLVGLLLLGDLAALRRRLRSWRGQGETEGEEGSGEKPRRSPPPSPGERGEWGCRAQGSSTMAAASVSKAEGCGFESHLPWRRHRLPGRGGMGGK